MTTVRKTESSLKRLKKGRVAEGGGDGGAEGMSDSDKIGLQLHLDVQVSRVAAAAAVQLCPARLARGAPPLLLQPGDPPGTQPPFRRACRRSLGGR